MNDCTASPELCLAQSCFGYGNWAAPYWFIGLEEGLGKDEQQDVEKSLRKRCEAFLELNREGLCDCKTFHEEIGEKRLHGNFPILESTWRPLMLLLKAYLREPADNDSLRKFQREEWGRGRGNTCLIELSGIPRRAYVHNAGGPPYWKERSAHIGERMSKSGSKLAVFYGCAQRGYWKEVIPGSAESDVICFGTTQVLFVPHPNTRGLTNDYWKVVGETAAVRASKVK